MTQSDDVKKRSTSEAEARPTLPRRIRGALRRSILVWESWQVELNGKYSQRRISAFSAYEHKTPWLRAVLVCVLTPLPTLALATAVEFIPLRHPSLGIHANYVFWMRDWLAVFFISVGFLEQFRNCLPRLPLSNAAMAGVSVFASNVGVGFQYLCARLIGFPLPFAPIFGASMWAVAMVFGCWLLWRTQLRQSATLRTEMQEYIVVFTCQCSLTVVYPAYIFCFNSLDGHGLAQNAFVVVLSLIKIAMRRWIAHFLRHEDLLSEVVIFNIDVFHALYVSCSLQTGTSLVTTCVVMAIDLVQAVITLLDISHLYSRIQVLLRKANKGADRPDRGFFELCNDLLHDMRVSSHPTLQPPPIPRRFTFRTVRPLDLHDLSSPTSLQVKPSPVVCADPMAASTEPGDHPAVDNVLSLAERVEFIRLSGKLLFLTEFIALVEFTEVVMPLVYALYSVAMSNLANRQFYPRLVQVPHAQLYDAAKSVVAYAAMELVTFVAFTWLVGRWLRISVLRQVAFVLETHASEVQSKLLVWLFFVLQSMLMHFGVDFSMKFEWLKYDWKHAG